MKKLLLTFIILLGSWTCLQATTFLGRSINPDSTQISLLTCSPGELIYELFGHTGIRICDPTNNIDCVVNYGLFDFEQPNFVSRFVRGKTDYMVGVNHTASFVYSYAARGSSVTQSTLNLTTAEKVAILSRLNENLLPENREYRYNFIYNNCATKVRDIIEMSANGRIMYPTHVESYSFRESLMLYTENAPWSQLGFDLCLGSDADKTASQREMLFLPEILGEIYASSKLKDSVQIRPLCTETYQLTPKTSTSGSVWLSPMLCAYLLLFIALFASYYLRNNPLYLEVFDTVIFTINAIGGVVVTFLLFFSQHPFTGENYNAIWMNPLSFFPLLACIFPFLKKINGLFYLSATIMFMVFVVLMPMLSQHFNLAVLPWVLTLLLRSYLRFNEIKQRHKNRIPI